MTSDYRPPDHSDLDADLRRLEAALAALFDDPSPQLWQTIDIRLIAASHRRKTTDIPAIDLLAGILLTVVLAAMLVGFWTLMLSITTGTHVLR